MAIVVPGNIDPRKRPTVRNPDGSVSTVRTISIGTDQGEVLIPTVVNGRVVSDDEAFNYYKKTGQHFGIFKTPEEATAYAQQLHQSEERRVMANPFAAFAPRGAPAPIEDEPAPPPAPVVNDFADFAPPPAEIAEPLMDNWQTQVRGKNIVFSAPRGSSTAQIRALAKKAGVPDPQNRSLKFMGENAEPERTVAQEEAADSPWTAALHHGVDFVAPVVDEIAAGVDAMFTDRTYRDNMRNLEERSELLSEENPWATNLGRAGGVISTIPIAVGTKALQGANWLGTSLRTAAAGAPIGAVNAYLSNPLDDRWNGVGTAAGLGGIIGGVLPGVTNLTGSLANRVDQRLGISDWVRRRIMGQSAEQSAQQGAVDVMAARIPQDPTAMRARAQEFRDTGHEPVLANVVDESGRGFVGAMARRPGPGRETATQAYDAARLSMPERLDRNMAAAIDRSTEGAPARTAVQAELNRPLDDVVKDLKETRSAEIDAAMLPIRNDPVPLTPRMVEILDTADGRRAIARAMRTVTDTDTIEAMKRLPAMLKALRGIDPRMPPAVRDQIVAQITKDGGLTVDIADRLARKFNAIASTGDSDASRALQGFAREIRDEAKAASGGYRKAMEDYAATSKTLDAVDTGGQFLSTNQADEFANRAAKVDGTTATPGVPSDQQRMMQGARREVQKAAGENIANAPSVARRIAVSPEQHVRNVATFGPINAEALEKTMAISERQLKDLAQVAPNTGSATALRSGDDAAAADMLQAAVHLKTGNWGQAAMNVLRSIGVRDAEAGEIVKMALDPNQVDTLIDMLEASYGKQTAAKISRAIALPAITGSSRTVAGGR